MLQRIITGGQTGADQAAWRAAARAGLATGGTMPRGFQTEAGPRPEFAARFGAIANDSDDPADRTLANVRDADATLVLLASEPGPGTRLTIEAARTSGKPLLAVDLDQPSPEAVARWLLEHQIHTLNVAGDRESHAPGLGERVEAFLSDVIRLL
jgi:hypothetical protein